MLPSFAGFTEKIAGALKPLHSDVNIFKKGDAELKDLHYNDNDRISEFVLVGNEGVVLVNNATKNFTLSKYDKQFSRLQFIYFQNSMHYQGY